MKCVMEWIIPYPNILKPESYCSLGEMQVQKFVVHKQAVLKLLRKGEVSWSASAILKHPAVAVGAERSPWRLSEHSRTNTDVILLSS